MPRFRRILLFLLFGAVVNVLVAWACARWVSGPNWNEVQSITGRDVSIVPAAAIDWVGEPSFVKQWVPVGTSSFRETVLSTFGTTRTAYAMPSMLIASRLKEGVQPPACRTHETHAFGLPMRSMQHASRGEHDPVRNVWTESWRVPGWRGGWPIMSSRVAAAFVVSIPNAIDRLSQPQEVVYPLSPVPWGFVVNTVFYAFLLWLPIATFTTLRRRRRIRRNLCSSCGYNLAGAVPTNGTIICPECGKPSA